MPDRQQRNVIAAVSRRKAISAVGVGAAAMLTLGLAPGLRKAASSPISQGDDEFLAGILVGPVPRIPKRNTPYRLTHPLLIAGGVTVTIEPGTRIVWAGPSTSAKGSIGVFEAAGDDTCIKVADGGEAFVECETPSPSVFAAVMRGKRGFTVAGLQARECQHVHVQATAQYQDIRTGGSGSNLARHVRILGGGARYTAPQAKGEGACLLSYVADCHVERVHYENVSSGIQWWGGDAGLEPWQNGARINERKCYDITIVNASVRHAHVGGIWGSMGRNIVVSDCRVEECLDVGFDAEGCVDTKFERCVARNGHNGCFATFSLCDGVRFIDCQGSVDRKEYPLLRIYNMTQSSADNRNIEVVGGRFECLDPNGPGTMDTAMGPVQNLTITDAKLNNVRIDTAFFNMHQTRISGNTLTFPFALPSISAIRVGASKMLENGGAQMPGSAVVANNRIYYTAASAKGEPVAIQIREDDFNANATGKVTGNIVSGPFAVGVSLINATGNIGIVPTFDVAGNRFSALGPSARLLSIVREGVHAPQPIVRWDDAQTRDGRATGLRKALG